MAIRVASSLLTLDPGGLHLRRAARTLTAALAALLVTGALVHVAHQPGNLAAVSVVVTVMVARHPVGVKAVVRVPVAGTAVGLIGELMVRHVVVGVAVFVAAVFGARLLIGRGGRARRFGRSALSPLIAMFVVPVAPGPAPGPLWVRALWAGAACAVAAACVWGAQALVLPARAGRDAAAGARAFVRYARRGWGPAALHRAALTVDESWPPARPLSAALLRAEALAEAAPADPRLRDALAEVEALAAKLPSTGTGKAAEPATAPANEPATAPATAAVHLRLAAQLATALALAFAVGHLLLPDRWNWPVITAFVVCGSARSRSDVVHRSALRVLGAVSGALAATPVAYVLRGHTTWSVVVIFGYLFIGLWLRDITYTAWAFCVTSLLAVLYRLYGDPGTASAMLVERPAGILLGSACGIAAAFLVLPVRTERVLRSRTATALRALQSAVGAATADPAELPTHVRAFDRAVADLRTVATLGRAAPVADLLDTARAHLRTLVLTLPAPPALARTAANIGCVRRKLGRRPDARPPSPLPEGAPLAELNAMLAALYAHL